MKEKLYNVAHIMVFASVGMVIGYLIKEHYFEAPTPNSINIPESDLVLTVGDRICYAWHENRSTEFNGASPNVWICEDGFIMYDQSGGNLPFDRSNEQ